MLYHFWVAVLFNVYKRCFYFWISCRPLNSAVQKPRNIYHTLCSVLYSLQSGKDQPAWYTSNTHFDVVPTPTSSFHNSATNVYDFITSDDMSTRFHWMRAIVRTLMRPDHCMALYCMQCSQQQRSVMQSTLRRSIDAADINVKIIRDISARFTRNKEDAQNC